MYLLNYISLLLLSFISVFISLDKKLKNILYFYSVVSLITMGCLRDYIGTDYATYVQIFDFIENININSNIEIGFQFIMIFIKNLLNDHRIMFAFVMIVSMIFFYKGVLKSSEYPIFSTFIFFSVFYVEYLFNGIRQGLTMCIFLYSLKFYKENNIKKILILSIIATSIHSSGIIIFLAYFLKDIYLSNVQKILILVIGIILCYINPFEKILIMIPIDFIRNKLISYGMSDFYQSFTLTNILQRVLILVFLIFNSKYISKNIKYIFNIYFLGWVVYFLFSFEPIIATRINMFFRILEIILFPNIIYNMKGKYKIFSFLLVVLWCSILLLSILKNPYNYPYKMINLT